MRYSRPVWGWASSATHLTGFGGWVFGAKGNNNSDNISIDNDICNVTNNSSNDNNNNTSFAGRSAVMTGFVNRASALKRRHRGKGQYEFARQDAKKFLESEVPLNGTNVWMEKGTNALALAQLLNFFEIEPDPSLLSLITNKLLRMLDDTNIDSITRLSVAIVLSQRSDLHMERIFSAVADILSMIKRGELEKSVSDADIQKRAHIWNIIELAAKVMQRNNKHTPATLNESLLQMTMTQLKLTSVTEFSYLQPSLLRVYGWIVRIGKVEEANHILSALVEHTGEFYGYDFSTLMNSCLRHHQLCPLPLPLLYRLARVGLMYSTSASGRDVASILASTAKILGSLEPGKNGVTQRDVSELGGRMNMLLGEYEPRVLRFLDPTDKLHWNHCSDVTSIVFAYEMGGRLRYKHVFLAYQAYVAQHVTRFEPQQLAMAAGILRRSQLLSRDLAAKLGYRIETVLGEFSLSEISHICCTFAPMSPTWMPEAKAVASRLLTQECSNYTKLTLAMAFPDDETLRSTINYKEISGRQLVDAMTLANGVSFEGFILSELVARLNSAQERFSPDDLRMIQASGRQELQAACKMYLSSRFAESEWTSDTLFSLPLASGIPHALNPEKALTAAKTVSVSPEQFVLLVELITGVFNGESENDIANFVITGGEELLGEERIRLGTVLRYLEAVHPLRKMHPGGEWLAQFNKKLLHSMRGMKIEEMKSLLCSFREIYGDVARQPLLQQTLNEVVFGPYSQLTQPDEDAAQVTVLIAHMQNGMLQPPLTESTTMAVSVRNNAAAYSSELRDAVIAMPLSKGRETKRLGRFTVKAARILGNPAPQPAPFIQDVNAALDMDPFGITPQTNIASTTATQVASDSVASPTPPEAPQTQSTSVTPQEVVVSSREAAPAVDDTNTRQQYQQSGESFSASSIPVSQNEGTHVFTSGRRLWNFFGGLTADVGTKHKEDSVLTQQAPPTSSQPQPAMRLPEDKSDPEFSSGPSSYVRLFNQPQRPIMSAELGQLVEKPGEVVDSAATEERVLRPRRTTLPRMGAQNLVDGHDAMPTVSHSYGYNQRNFSENAWNGPSLPPPQPPQPGSSSSSSWSSFWGTTKFPPMESAPGNNKMPGSNFSGLQKQIQTSRMIFGGGIGGHFAASNQQQEQQGQEVLTEGTNAEMMQQQPHQHQQKPQQQLVYRKTPHAGMVAPGNNLFVDPASSLRPRPVITKTNPTAKIQEQCSTFSNDGVDQTHPKNPSSTKQVAQDLKKTGNQKSKGGKIDAAEGTLVAGEQKSFCADATAHGVRRGKGESKGPSRSQRNLSEWLNAPSKHKVEDSEKGRAVSSAKPAAKGHPKERVGRGHNRNNMAARGKGSNTRTPPSKLKVGAAERGAVAKTASKGASKQTAKASQSGLKKTEGKKMQSKGLKKLVTKKVAGSTIFGTTVTKAKKDLSKRSLETAKGGKRRR